MYIFTYITIKGLIFSLDHVFAVLDVLDVLDALDVLDVLDVLGELDLPVQCTFSCPLPLFLVAL